MLPPYFHCVNQMSLCQAVLERCGDPRQACHDLVDAANDSGGRDNISVVVIRVSPGSSPS